MINQIMKVVLDRQDVRRKTKLEEIVDLTELGLKKRFGISKTSFKFRNFKVKAVEKHRKLHICSTNFEKKDFSCFTANLYQR